MRVNMNTVDNAGPDGRCSTGLPGLDKILHGLMPGDNLVWQVESAEDSIPFVQPFCDVNRESGRRLVYFRFASHLGLVTDPTAVRVCPLRPEAGFEAFITEIHKVMGETGGNAGYVFDSLSDLAISCYSERMIGNFFALTCPYLLRLGAIGYFTVLRHYHSHHAALPIENTTQILLDVYRQGGKTYVHPLKVAKRYSPTMHMLHRWEGVQFLPVTESATVSDVMTSGPWHGLQSASYRMVGMWDRRFIEAEDTLEAHLRGESSPHAVQSVFLRQLEQLITRDERMRVLSRKYFSLADLIHIWKRTIGSGLIGGKAVGMLLARAILRAQDPRWTQVLEPHDSFFIGSDIFYSFLVENGCWPIRQRQKYRHTLFDGAEEGRQRILDGVFPDYIVRRFSDMLDYFGQCPVIVRSSSLLEDNFGNAFSGKYESVFCVNQGTREERVEAFLGAVRRVYASTMSEEALVYRAKRGVLDRDEQMALLVQRVSGSQYGDLFFPQLAGVAFSFNAYAWDPAIDPNAGLLRLVFGLGTRAVDRHDDDYTRLVALNAPEKRPEGDTDEVRHYTQRKVDILDCRTNSLRADYFDDIIPIAPGLPAERFTVRTAGSVGTAGSRLARMLSFEPLFKKTALIQDMHAMLQVLRDAYGCHVDVEITANLQNDETFRINLLQCRPLQVYSEIATPNRMPDVEPDRLLLKANGGIIGPGRFISVARILYVVPSVYGLMPESERHAVARVIGRLAHIRIPGTAGHIMLLGPGRWGTRMASLGVPVSFSEIHSVSVICEMACMHEQLTPDLSLGTHYFNDIVEMGMLYLGFTPGRNGNILNVERLAAWPNRLAELIPEAADLSSVINVIDGRDAGDGLEICLHADAIRQTAILYLSPATPVESSPYFI